MPARLLLSSRRLGLTGRQLQGVCQYFADELD
jgi:hypothetical protein